MEKHNVTEGVAAAGVGDLCAQALKQIPRFIWITGAGKWFRNFPSFFEMKDLFHEHDLIIEGEGGTESGDVRGCILHFGGRIGGAQFPPRLP